MLLSFFGKPYSDQEIVEMLQSGNALKENKAISHLMNMQEKVLTAYIKKRIPAHREIKSVFLETMTVFFEQVKFKGFVVEKDGAILRFLYKVAERRCKKEQTTKGFEQLTEWKVGIEDAKIIKDFSDKALQEFFQKAINSLPSRCQVVIRKYYYKGMRHKDIAESLNITLQGSKNTLYRCMNKLKSLLNGGDIQDVLFD